MLSIIKNKETIHIAISAIKIAFESSKVSLPKLSKFVFVCGANKKENDISERRRAILDFAKRSLPDSNFFLAEKVFSVLQEEGHKKNLLDIEHQISVFSDHIIIILESPSSFAELGAFSHEKLREKLIVINDYQFIDEKSFINLGPLEAIKESTSPSNVIYYKMKSDGVHKLDAIGDTFNNLYSLLKTPINSKNSKVRLERVNPSLVFDKFSAMFIHDVLYFTGPLKYAEIIEVLKLIFGNQDFKLREILAMLVAFGSIKRNNKGWYKSNNTFLYYKYNLDENMIVSTFRSYSQKYHPERIYEY